MSNSSFMDNVRNFKLFLFVLQFILLLKQLLSQNLFLIIQIHKHFQVFI